MPVSLTQAPSELAPAPHPAAPRARWLSVVSHLDPKYGGLSAAVPQLAARLAGTGRLQVGLEAFCLPGEEYRPATHPELPVAYWPTSRKAWLIDAKLRKSFREAVAAADGVHIHGLWEQSSLAASRAAQALGKPYIVSAHGMLEPWALDRSRAKKRLYAALFERATLGRAACLHALTRAEARNYRDFGCRGPIAVIPNAVEIPQQLSPDLFLEAFPEVRDRRILLFLGRLHQKKGVEMLVRAWAGKAVQAAARASNACLVLAGPSEDDTCTRVEQLVSTLGLGTQVLLPGMLAPGLKWSALPAAEGFVLPSYSEGLSIATLEAMGAGLPVIVTENCHLPEVVEAGAGWQVRAEAAELARSLEAWLGNTPAANRALGQRGAQLVSERFSWPVVAAQMAALYTWVEEGADLRSASLPQSLALDLSPGSAAHPAEALR